MVAKHGVYYTYDLVYFIAQKWLSKVRDNKVSDINKIALPIKLSDERAENTLFTIRTTDHITPKTHTDFRPI